MKSNWIPSLIVLAGAVPALAALPEQGYVAHEWGTFTSLQDSTGRAAEGMDHSDELLPSFVHGRSDSFEQLLNGPAMPAGVAFLTDAWQPHPGPTWTPEPEPTYYPPCHSKGCDFDVTAGSPLTVTQKMETPVIYFYSKEARNVKVDIDFPGGIITQYYPNVTDFAPALGKVAAVANGHVHWDAQVAAPTQSLAVPQVAADSIWAPSRQTSSNYVSVGGENEKLLFYRGLGHFDTPFRVSDGASALSVQNLSNERVPQAFLLKVTAAGGAIQELGAIPALGGIDVSHETIEHIALQPTDRYLSQALQSVSVALEQSGLYHDEALAMVNTWKKSYFTTPGLRILYVLPREWTDKLLPLTLSPAPHDLVRTLVGRVEVLTQKEEQTVLTELKTAFATGQSGDAIAAGFGRFAESKLRRELQLAEINGESPAFIAYLGGLVQEMTKR